MIGQLEEVAVLAADVETQANENGAENDQCYDWHFEIFRAVIQR